MLTHPLQHPKCFTISFNNSTRHYAIQSTLEDILESISYQIEYSL